MLAESGELRCALDVEHDRDEVTVTLRVREQGVDGGLSVLALLHALEYLRDVAQVRAFASRHGLDGTEVDRLIALARRRSEENEHA